MTGGVHADAEAPPRLPRRGWVLLWTGIALIVIGPAAGLLGTALGMTWSFWQIEAQPAPTPDDLAVGAHTGLAAMLLGALLALVGLVLVVAGVVRLTRSPAAHEQAP